MAIVELGEIPVNTLLRKTFGNAARKTGRMIKVVLVDARPGGGPRGYAG